MAKKPGMTQKVEILTKGQSKAEILSKGQQKKKMNRLDNESRAHKNAEIVRELGIQPEKTTRVITRINKRGKKTFITTTEVEKNKRPSQLIRKHLRSVNRSILDLEIAAINSKLEAPSKKAATK